MTGGPARPGPDTPAPGGRKFVALEGWRGVAAVMIVMFHYTNFSIWHLGQLALIIHARPFVDFFFVLSGFVMAHAYGGRIAAAPDALVFMLRRFGRLWPLHASLLLVWIAVEIAQDLAVNPNSPLMAHPAFTGYRGPTGILGNLLLLHSMIDWPAAEWNIPSWSISVEFWTYLVFALACLLPGRSRVLAFAGLSLLGVWCLWGTRYNLLTPAPYAIFRCLYGFFLGCLTYKAYGALRLKQLRGATLLEWLCVVAIVGLISAAGLSPLNLTAPPLFAVTIFLFAFEAGALSRLLASGPMARLGTWSYSIYLVHYLVIRIAMAGLRHVGGIPARDATGQFVPMMYRSEYVMDAIALAMFLAVLLLSSQTYRWIEMPARRYFNALADRLEVRQVKIA